MAVLVRNETGEPWFVTSTNKRGQGEKFIAIGATIVLSDLEWAEVALTKRGPGGLNPLDPSLGDAAETKSELDYFASGFATTELRYLGESYQQALDTDPVWTIKRFDYVQIASGDVRISEIQVLVDVPWGTSTGDRDALAWT